MRRERLPILNLRAIVYQDPDSEEFLAHCLELDLMASGSDQTSALNNLLDVVREQIRFALSHDNVEHLLRPAPAEAWARYAELLKQRFRTESRPIDVRDEARNFEPQLEVAIAS